ncbi:MAG: hypothetical protein ACREIR_16180 [Geminicoccaceae bacterium]
MTAADRRGAGAMAESPSGQAGLRIGSMTVRGRGLSAATGQSLATAVAAALTGQLPARSARVRGITIRMPASVLDRSGRIDRAAVARAVVRARRHPDA